MFYFKLLLTSLLAVASLAGMMNLFLSPRSLKTKVSLTLIIVAFAIILYIVNLHFTIPKLLFTQEYSPYIFDRKNYINLKLKPAVLEYSSGYENFWLGLHNFSKNETYINPVVFIHFVDKIDIDSVNTTENGWRETEPNESYDFKFDDDLHSSDSLRAEPMLIKCDKPGNYRAICSISARDRQKLEIPFVIRIDQPKKEQR